MKHTASIIKLIFIALSLQACAKAGKTIAKNPSSHHQYQKDTLPVTQPQKKKKAENLSPKNFTNITQASDCASFSYVCFAPESRCVSRLTEYIQGHNTQKSIYIQAYSLTHQGLMKALIDKKKQNPRLTIQIIIDVTQIKNHNRDHIKRMHEMGIEVRLYNKKSSLAHNKIVIIDEKIMFTGSSNFSMAADQRNQENIICIESPNIVALYTENFHQKFAAVPQENFTHIDQPSQNPHRFTHHSKSRTSHNRALAKATQRVLENIAA